MDALIKRVREAAGQCTPMNGIHRIYLNILRNADDTDVCELVRLDGMKLTYLNHRLKHPVLDLIKALEREGNNEG